VALRQLFQDNADARINNLNTEICNTVQGSSFPDVYYQRIQTMADELRELCDPVQDRQLINIVLQGLSDRFEKQASFIPMMRPCPTFAEVRSLLQCVDNAQSRKEARPHVFTATPRPPPPLPAVAGEHHHFPAAAQFPAVAGQQAQIPVAAAPPVQPPPG
jgi:hypothetical protein